MKYAAFLLRAALVGLMIATGSLCAKTHYSNKTYLSSRAPGVNLAMEYTTWHDHVYKGKSPRTACAKRCVKSCSRPCNHAMAPSCAKPCNPKTLNSHFQVTGFYQDSTNKAEVGEYFGIGNGKNSFVVGDDAAVASNPPTANILNRLLIHKDDVTGGPSTLAGNVSFNPHQQIAGLRFDYFQDLTSPLCGMFFKMRMPVVWVEHDMKLRVAGSVNSDPAPGFSLQDFFKGNVSETTDGDNLQDPLTKAKINGRRHKFGVADIDLAVGYKCVHSDTGYLFLNAGITIPTGNKVRGEYLFEPVCGNGQHFGLGAGIDAGAELWCNQNAAFHILAAAEYRYLFERTEERTVGVNGTPFGQYFLAGKANQQDEPLFPAANVLTQGLKVKPGSQLDSMVAVAFKSGGFVLDVGYNMFWKDNEDVWLKNWQDGVYALANVDYPTSAQFDLGTRALQPLNRADLNVQAAATPSLFTHKIFGGIGYTSKICSCPLSFGIGGSYEFATTNADLENYAVWAKIMISC